MRPRLLQDLLDLWPDGAEMLRLPDLVGALVSRHQDLYTGLTGRALSAWLRGLKVPVREVNRRTDGRQVHTRALFKADLLTAAGTGRTGRCQGPDSP